MLALFRHAWNKLGRKIKKGVKGIGIIAPCTYKQKDEDKPTLNSLIPFGIFKAISNAARDTMPADYEYYKDKTDFFYDVKLPFHKKWITEKIVRKEMSKIL